MLAMIAFARTIWTWLVVHWLRRQGIWQRETCLPNGSALLALNERTWMADSLKAGGSVEGATGWNPGRSAADYIMCNSAPKMDARPVSHRGPGWDRLLP
jgi:hypothetical protein